MTLSHDDLTRLAEEALLSSATSLDPLVAAGEAGLEALFAATASKRLASISFRERQESEARVATAFAIAAPHLFASVVRRRGLATLSVLEAAGAAHVPETDRLLFEALANLSATARELAAHVVGTWRWRADGPWRDDAMAALGPCLLDPTRDVRTAALTAAEAVGGPKVLAALDSLGGSALLDAEERRVLGLVRERVRARWAAERQGL